MKKFEVATKIGRLAEKIQDMRGFEKIGNALEEVCKKISFNAADMLFDYTGWSDRDFEWEGDEEEK